MLTLNLPEPSLLTGFQNGPLPRNYIFCPIAEGSGRSWTLNQIITMKTLCPISTVHTEPLGKDTQGLLQVLPQKSSENAL